MNKGKIISKYLDDRALIKRSDYPQTERFNAARRALAMKYLDKYPFLNDSEYAGSGYPAADLKTGIHTV